MKLHSIQILLLLGLNLALPNIRLFASVDSTSNLVCTITCPDDIYAGALPGETAIVNYTVTTSGCMGGAIQISGLPSGSEFPIGTTTNCFQATDGMGNTPTCCFNVIVYELIVECPPAYIGSCGSSTDPNTTGWPTFDGNFIDPDYSCYHATYSDNFLNDCGNGVKITRTWTITNTCGNPTVQCTQIIKLSDDEAPIITCPGDIEVPCNLTDPEYTGYPLVVDACGSNYDLTYTPITEEESCIGPLYDFTRYWTATDECGNSSSCAFLITVTCRPLVQASFITFTTTTTNQISFYWTNGDGDHRIVLMNSVNSFIAPADGSYPFPDMSWNHDGQQVIYNDQGDNVTVTNLDPNTTYWFRVYEGLNCKGSTYYNVSTAAGNPKSQTTLNGCVPITINSHPSQQFPDIPNPVTFTVEVSGTSPGYQWQYNAPGEFEWHDLSNVNNTTWTTIGNSSTLTVHNTNGLNGYGYHCIISNTCSSIISGEGDIIASISSYKVSTKLPYAVGTYPNPFTLAFGNINTPSEKVKICADGTKATLVEYTNFNASIPISNIRFKLESDQNGLNPDLYGAFVLTDYQITGNTIKTRLTHPRFLPSTYLPFRPDKILIIDINNPTSPLFTIPIEIYRPPVLFVHGWLGNHLSFIDMSTDLIHSGYYPDKLVNNAYYTTTLESFETNAYVVRDWLYKSFYKSISNRFSAGKIDIVSHSMGGIMSRLYIQNNYNNHYRGDVNKLITLNTPHSGSYFANAIATILGIGLAPGCGFYNLVGSSSFLCHGATHDMATNSYAMDKVLNSPTSLSTNHIPSHAVITTNDILPLSNYNQEPIYLVGGPILTSILNLFTYLCGGDEHDGVVSVLSQTGGLTGTNTTTPAEHFHVGTPKVGDVITDVKGLLSSSPTSNQFSPNGFQPYDLFSSPNSGQNVNINSPDNSNRSFGSINIEEPLSGSVYIPGGNVSIIIQADGDIHQLLAVIGNSTIQPFIKDTLIAGDQTQFVYPVPKEAIGKIIIGVIGFDALGKIVATDSVHINIEVNAALDSISISPDQVVVPTNLETHFQAFGHFADSVVREITLLPEVLASTVNINIAKILLPGTIEGVTVDTTSLSVSYRNKTKIIPVLVYEGDSLRHALFDADVNVICDSGNVQFQNLTTGHAQQIAWSFPGGIPASSSAENPSIYYKDGGQYDVSLIATYNNMVDTLLLENYVTVRPKPTLLLAPSGPIAFCPGDSVSLSVTSSSASLFLWSTGTLSDHIIVKNPGSYFVTGIDDSGCSLISDTISITESTVTKPIIVGDSALCRGSSTVLEIQNIFTSYQWSTGQTTSNIEVDTEGDYIITVYDQSGCQSVSDTFVITVLELPVVDLGPESIDTSGPIILDAGPGFTEYVWNTDDMSQTITASDSGWYSVTITDINGCSASDSIYVNLITDVINVDESDRLTIYPNPSDGQFHISGQIKNPSMIKIKVISPIGQIIFISTPERVDNNFDKTIELNNPVSGLYYTVIDIGNKRYINRIMINSK